MAWARRPGAVPFRGSANDPSRVGVAAGSPEQSVSNLNKNGLSAFCRLGGRKASFPPPRWLWGQFPFPRRGGCFGDSPGDAQLWRGEWTRGDTFCSPRVTVCSPSLTSVTSPPPGKRVQEQPFLADSEDGSSVSCPRPGVLSSLTLCHLAGDTESRGGWQDIK